jgi:phosphotransacetylase
MLENHTWEELRPGDVAELRRLCTADDLFAFAAATGNHDPLLLPGLDGDGDGLVDGFVPDLFAGALISAVLGTRLPGPGTRCRSLRMQFHARARAGDDLVARVTVTDRRIDGTILLATEVQRLSDSTLILSGEAEVTAPTTKFRLETPDLPGLTVQRHRHFDAILARAAPLPSLITAVVWPDDPDSLEGALLAQRHTIITPLLIGDPARIAQVAATLNADLSTIRIIPADSPHTAAACAVALVRDGRAQAVMKGSLHTDDLLRPILQRDTGLRGTRRLSHVFVMDVPGAAHPILVTDAAINIAPDLTAKMDIVQNAIDLAISIGIERPRVGVLSAVELINPAIPSSIDAALLSKMAERGQITGGDVDGPLAMDNAVDIGAARRKGLTSSVAGRAEVLVVPGIDAGNMLAKQLTYLSHAEAAGVVIGATVPIILTSRSDSAVSRLASCAVAALHQARLGRLR